MGRTACSQVLPMPAFQHSMVCPIQSSPQHTNKGIPQHVYLVSRQGTWPHWVMLSGTMNSPGLKCGIPLVLADCYSHVFRV